MPRSADDASTRHGRSVQTRLDVQMSKKRPTIFGLSAYQLLPALLLGVLLATYVEWRNAPDVEPETEGVSDTVDTQAGLRPMENRTARTAPDVPDAVDERGETGSVAPEPTDDVVYAQPGLTLRPERIADRFVGYRVLRNESDSRFEAGDIIAAVNGIPTEDSAAGSELLIAALMNPDADVRLYEDADR